MQHGNLSEVSPIGAKGSEDLPGSDIRQYVTFMVGDEVFAVEMAPVQEIIRVPEVVRVPLSPQALNGLANLRGRVLPIVSLRRVLGYPARAEDDTSRAVVIDIGQPMGFVVDHVASVVGVDASKVEGVGNLGGTVSNELLSGLVKDVGGHAMVMVLNFDKLIAQEFAALSIARAGTGTETTGSSAASAPPRIGDDELHLVSFDVADQEYAIAIEDVQEIVQVPDQIVQVPHARSHVLGVMTLRNRVLPLVSLRRLFGLTEQRARDENRLVVVAVGGASVGILVDSVKEVLRVARRDVESVPALLAREGELSDVTSICRIEGGRRLVSVISTPNLFRHSAIKEAMTAMDANQHASGAAMSHQEESSDDEQVVVFRLGNEEFGVPIDSVQEIVRVPDALTQVPRAPAAVVGVINLRGAVLPVVDLRRRLGLAAVPHNDGQRIVVLLIRGVRTGFIVDAVAEVLKVPRASIERAPSLSAEQSALLARVVNLEQQKRMLQLIEPTHLLGEGDLAHMSGIQG